MIGNRDTRSREAEFAPSACRHYLGGVTDKPKRPRDANQLAKFIVDVATGGACGDGPVEKQATQQRGDF